MKKIISILCIVAMMMSFTTICANAWAISDKEGEDYDFEPLSYVGFVGDVDSTDEVNIVDATYIQMHIAKLVELKGANRILADVDQSEALNIMDATCIQMWVAKLPVKAPVYHQLGDNDFGEHICSYSINFVSNKCQDGYVEYECECGEWYSSNYKEASHNWKTIKVVEPDCDDGYSEVVCKDCGFDSIIWDRGTGTGHDWGEWQIYIEPQIGLDGEERLYCSKCDDYQSRTIDMLVEGDQEIIAMAREMLSDFKFTVQDFETVDELFSRKYQYGVGEFTFVFFQPLIREGKYKVDEETGFYVFNRSDLDAIAIKYFDKTFDWTTRTMESSEYYDAATDTVHFKLIGGWGGPLKYTVSSFTDNNDGTYTIGVIETYAVEKTYKELVLKKTEYGYPAVSFMEVEN